MQPSKTTSPARCCILALASGKLPSPVAILRISGEAVAEVVENKLNITLAESHKASLKTLQAEGRAIDQAIVIYFEKNRSFTGEPVVEIHCHGSLGVVDSIIKQLTADSQKTSQRLLNKALEQESEKYKVKMAEAGEFSRRAFLNGKIDLRQAESLADLIDAQTSEQSSQALIGLLKSAPKLDQWNQSIINMMAKITALIEFEEDDNLIIEPDLSADIEKLITNMQQSLKQTHADFVRKGASIVLEGQANVGKSSILNCLAGYEAAIVDSGAGTTRDPIEVSLKIDGFLVRVFDTAGIREAKSRVEREGILRAKKLTKDAFIRLRVISFNKKGALDEKIPQKAGNKEIWLINKSDLLNEHKRQTIIKALPDHAVILSAKKEEGIEKLIEKISKKLSSARLKNNDYNEKGDAFITRKRHKDAIEQTCEALARVNKIKLPEIIIEELRQAQLSLSRISGLQESEKILDQVFSEFCIGK